MTSTDAESFEELNVAGRRHLLVDVDAASAARRSVGPTCWAVLEVLASRADIASPRAEVRCTARALADDLGLSKDTTARALRNLARRGFVRRLDHRAAASSRFAATTYEVELAAAGPGQLPRGVVERDGGTPERVTNLHPDARAHPGQGVPSGHGVVRHGRD